MRIQAAHLDDYDVVKGGKFSYVYEPALTFNPSRNLIYINGAGLKRLPDMEYALIVISSSEKRLCILPCDAGELNAVRLRSNGRHRNKPLHVRCHVHFVEEITFLMKWKKECRYRIPGYTAIENKGVIIAFDLLSAEEFPVSAS